MKIKIKRATVNGVKEDEGDFLEINGYQFAFVKDPCGLYFLIELHTGANVCTVDSDDNTKSFALNFMKGKVLRISKENIEAGITLFKKEFPEFSYPLNEPINISAL